MMRRGFLTIALCLVVSALTAHAAESEGPTVRVASGELRGETIGGLMIFRGIPFATPPVGDLRWRPPQPVQSWKGVRSATEFGHECMQQPSAHNSNPLRAAVSEDCLYLNVWAPRNRGSSRLPVMVWIHGGGFVNGGSSPAAFDGSHFAEQGIVFVSINYRLGRFGFFAFPALVQEGGLIGNYAFMDQIAALKWVRKNIEAFGGDPHKVTIFGQSAGGMSVNVLLTSPVSRGLFERAMIESGGGRDNLLGPSPLDRPGPHQEPSAEQIGINFARSVGIDGTDTAALAALRKLPAEAIVNGLNMGNEGAQRDTFSGPILDGVIVVRSTEDSFRRCMQAKVPVVVGANSADLGFSTARTMEEVFAPFGANADAARRAFDVKPGDTAAMIGRQVAAVRMMIEPARFIAQSLATCGEPSYEYRFSYVATPLRQKLSGAPHSSEIPYAFNTIRESTWGNFGKDLTKNDLEVAQQVNRYWVNFAKTGDPNGPGLPNWPRFSSKNDKLMDFTTSGTAGETDPWAGRLDLVEENRR